MSFFKSIGSLLGGKPSSATGSSFSGGFNSLPPEITDAYKGLGTEINNILKGGNLAQYTAPTPLSTGEQSAIDRLYSGFAPSQQTIGSDIAMQMNPFDEYVINEINRQAQAGMSGLNSVITGAGQTNSNRQFLGANDVDMARLNQIGKFKQEQYNTALQNALTTLPQARGQDALGALAGGTYARNIDTATNIAPIAALQELAKALGVLPTSEGTSSSTQSSTGASKGLLDFAAAIFGGGK